MFVSCLPVAGAVSFWLGPFCAAAVPPPVVQQKRIIKESGGDKGPWMERRPNTAAIDQPSNLA